MRGPGSPVARRGPGGQCWGRASSPPAASILSRRARTQSAYFGQRPSRSSPRHRAISVAYCENYLKHRNFHRNDGGLFALGRELHHLLAVLLVDLNEAGGLRGFEDGVELKLPHDYEDADVEQQYLPDELVGRRYYEPSGEGWEARVKERMDELLERRSRAKRKRT